VYFHANGFLLIKGGCGMFYVHNNLSVNCAHEGETNTYNESVQVLTQNN